MILGLFEVCVYLVINIYLWINWTIGRICFV